MGDILPKRGGGKAERSLRSACSKQIGDLINLLDGGAPCKEDQLIGAYLLKEVHRVQELPLCREQHRRFGCGEGWKRGIVVEHMLVPLLLPVPLKRNIDLSNQMGFARSASFLPALLNSAKRVINLCEFVCPSKDAISASVR